MLVKELSWREATCLHVVHLLFICSKLGINDVHELRLLDTVIMHVVGTGDSFVVLPLTKLRLLSREHAF